MEYLYQGSNIAIKFPIKYNTSFPTRVIQKKKKKNTIKESRALIMLP